MHQLFTEVIIVRNSAVNLSLDTCFFSLLLIKSMIIF